MYRRGVPTPIGTQRQRGHASAPIHSRRSDADTIANHAHREPSLKTQPHNLAHNNPPRRHPILQAVSNPRNAPTIRPHTIRNYARSNRNAALISVTEEHVRATLNPMGVGGRQAHRQDRHKAHRASDRVLKTEQMINRPTRRLRSLPMNSSTTGLAENRDLRLAKC